MNAPVSEVLALAGRIRLALALEQSEKLSRLQNWHVKYKSQLHRQYETDLYSNTPKAAIKIPVVPASFSENSPLVNGYEVLNQYLSSVSGFLSSAPS